MASTLKVSDAPVVAGKYRAKADFPSEDNSQLSLKGGEILVLQSQTEDRGWVWAQLTNPTGPKREGYVPRNYLEKVPEGDWDQWAYGCEIVSCFYTMFWVLHSPLWKCYENRSDSGVGHRDFRNDACIASDDYHIFPELHTSNLSGALSWSNSYHSIRRISIGSLGRNNADSRNVRGDSSLVL